MTNFKPKNLQLPQHHPLLCETRINNRRQLKLKWITEPSRSVTWCCIVFINLYTYECSNSDFYSSQVPEWTRYISVENAYSISVRYLQRYIRLCHLFSELETTVRWILKHGISQIAHEINIRRQLWILVLLSPLNNFLIIWLINQETTTAQSLTEAKCTALQSTVREVCWVQNVLAEVGVLKV